MREIELEYHDATSPEWNRNGDGREFGFLCASELDLFFHDIDTSKKLFLKISKQPFEEAYEVEAEGEYFIKVRLKSGDQERILMYSRAVMTLYEGINWVGIEQEEV